MQFAAVTILIVLPIAAAVLGYRAGRLRVIRSASQYGPKCPECGYSLCGVSKAQCSECGCWFRLVDLWAAQLQMPRKFLSGRYGGARRGNALRG